MKNEVRETIEERIVSLGSFRQAKLLLKRYKFQVSASKLRRVASQFEADPKKMVVMYLNSQIKKALEGVSGFEEGLMIKGDVEKALSRFRGIQDFFHQPKANQIWSVIYINFELAKDFNEAILRCKQLTKLIIDETKFVLDPVLSNRFVRNSFKIIECRKLFDAVPHYLVQNGDFSCLVKKKKQQTIAEVLQEVNCQWRRARVFYVV